MRSVLLFLLTITITTNLIAQLNGTYTIGGVAPNFNSAIEACNAIETQGINGPVVFNIEDGVYTDSIYLGSYAGASPINTITFQSASGDSSMVTLSTIGQNPVVKMASNSCRYITIKNLGFDGADAIGHTVRLDAIRNFNLENCYLVNGGFYTGNAGNNVDSLVVSQCRVEAINAGIGLFAAGNLQPVYIKVVGNVIGNFTSSGINLRYVMNAEVSNNTVKSINGNFAIELDYLYGNTTVFKNETYSENGLEVQTSSDRLQIINNMINARNDSYSIGMYFESLNDTVEIVNNTFVSDGVVFEGLLDNNPNIYISNNILRSYGTDPDMFDARYIYIFYPSVTPVFPQISNNAVYSISDFALMGGSTSVVYTDLSSFNSATGMDANSFVLVDPLFYNDSIDLHACSDSLLSTGESGWNITDDFDGDIRPAGIPSIGADYFTTPVADFSFTLNGTTVDFTNLSLNADSYYWDFGDGTNSTDVDPTHVFAGGMDYDITLIAYDVGSCEPDTFTVTINSVGLAENSNSSFNVFPNPSNGMIYFNTEWNGFDLTVTDAFGRVVLNKENLADQVDLSHLISGTYFLQLTNGSIQLRQKVILLSE